MKFATWTAGRLAVAAALVAVVVAVAGLGARPADAQGAPTVNAGGPYTGAVNIPITFTASASTGVPIISYTWNFGDGTTASGSIAQKTYTSAGTFTVTVTATANNGLSSSATTTASVGAVPTGTVYPYGSTYPYGYGSAVSPYVTSGLYNPYLTTGYPCGVPVTIGGSTVTSACSGPYANSLYPYGGIYPFGSTYPYLGSGCFSQPVITRFGTPLRRLC
jgi:PKD domain-containing protein